MMTIGSRLMLGALVLPTAAFGTELDRAPYLQSLTPNQATLVWRGEEIHNATVEVEGVSTDHSQVYESIERIQHEVTLKGLEPGQTYRYRIEGSEGVLSDPEGAVFQTAPATGDRSPIRVWVVGDSGIGGGPQLAVRDAMVLAAGVTGPDLMIHVGDMAYGSGTDEEFTQNFYAIYQEQLRSIPVWPAIGNHEGKTSFSADQSGPYFEGYVLPRAGEAGGLPSGTEAYYSFDHGNVHFISLDSHQSSRQPGDAMLTWLEADLAATSQEWIVAFWHHPPYTKGTHDSDTETRHIEMRENALPILEAGGVDLVLGGHSHIYERSYPLEGAYDTPRTTHGIIDSGSGWAGTTGSYRKSSGQAANEGAVYIVAGHGGTYVGGTGGHPLIQYYEVENGSVLLDFHENRLGIQNVRFDGVVTDRATLIKGDALQLVSPNGAEVLEPNSQQEIRWEAVGVEGPILVEFSCDNGENWEVVAENVPVDDSVDWTVPEIVGGEMRVRISAASDHQDLSDGVFSHSATRDETLFDFGSTWRFHDLGEDLGDDWNAVDYDDSAWEEGPGELGYGDGDEATLLEKAQPDVHPTVYFRKTVELDQLPSESEFQVIFDDAVAVWLNDELIFFENFGNGSSYGAWASQSAGDNALLVWGSDELPWALGSNVLGVMVKQTDAGSSDLSFDMAVDLRFDENGAFGACPSAEASGDSGDAVDDPDAGCACSTLEGRPPWGLLVLLGLAGVLRRRG
ncbi:MAG: metallophosphoesterase family protein [Myxococcota bacterium]|nr:metallophosphoesterase family protein [Myxococcota bacterium]